MITVLLSVAYRIIQWCLQMLCLALFSPVPYYRLVSFNKIVNHVSNLKQIFFLSIVVSYHICFTLPKSKSNRPQTGKMTDRL